MNKTLTKSMSVLILMLFLIIGFTSSQAQYRTTTWEKSSKLATLPTWIGADFERGLALGNGKVYVVSRKNATNILILNSTGDSTGVFNTTGVAGGTYFLNDVEVDADGAIYACNLTTSAVTSPFTIYKWATDAAAPTAVISFNAAGYRLGDKFTVVGSAANNTLTIYAATSSSNKLYRWTTANNGATFAVDSVTLTGVSTTSPGSTPAVYPLTAGLSEFVYKSNGSQGRRFNADGTVIDSLNATLLPTGSNAIRYFTANSKKYVVCFQYTGTPQNGLRVLDVTNQYSTQQLIVDYTPGLGVVANANGTGDVDLKVNGDGTVDVLVLGTNNGIALYKYYLTAIPETNTITTFPYTQNFDNGLITGAGWSGNFVERGTESKTGLAAKFIYNYIPTGQANLTYGYLISPKIQLPAGHRVKFWWKDDDITAVSGADTTFFEVSTNNGTTWTQLRSLSSVGAMAAYVEEVVDLSAYAGNSVRLRFRDKTNGTASAYGTGIDDFLIEALPVVPVISVSPVSTAFGTTYVGGNTQKTVVVSNQGGAPLNVTVTLTTGITANNTLFSVPSGSSANLNLTYTPTSGGTLNDSIRIQSNDLVTPSIYYKLTGTAVVPNVYTTISQSFDTSTTTIPYDWTGNFTIQTTGGVTNSKRLSKNLYGSALTGYFTTPFFSATATSQLKFNYRVVDYTGYPATATSDTAFKIYVSVSTNFGGTFTIVDSIGKNRHTPTLNYAEKTWNLAAYAGQTIQVRIDGTRLSGDFYSDFDDWYMGTPSASTIDWGNLQWPGTASITAGDSVAVYAQAYKAGVTDSAGHAFGLLSWIGISTTNTNPANWTTWIPAAFANQVGNNDEFMASIGKGLAPGTYYYASKFSYLNGPFKYGGFSGGFWDSTNNKCGVLTVNPFSISSLPYTQGFEETAFPPTGWTLVDRNGTPTWGRSTLKPHTGLGHARYSYSATKAADDWLISPSVTLTAGETYSLSYFYTAASNTFPEKLKVLVGRFPSPDSLLTVLADHPNIVNTTYQNNSVFFTAPVTGVYYFGFQAYSAMNMYNLDLDNITIAKLFAVDYAVVGLNQTVSPFTSASGSSFKLDRGREETQISASGKERSSSSVNNSQIIPVETSNLDFGLLGFTPVNLKALVKRLGSTGPAFVLNNMFNSVSGTPVNRPGVGTIGGVDTVGLSFTATARGTFSASATVVAVGDSNATNNTYTNDKVLVYPDSAFIQKNDAAETNALTSIGFATNFLPLTAGVRFTAPKQMRIANIDAYYRNEASADSIEVKVWAAGVDTLAPGVALYSKKFAGINYINSGAGLQYVTLPLGNDAPTFASGSDFWVSITYSSTIQYPQGAHAGTIPILGRSFLSSNGGAAWLPLVLSGVPYAWVIRTIGVNYTPPPPPVYTTNWEKSVATASLPSWFSIANYERGIAFGSVVDGVTKAIVEKAFVVSRNGGNIIKVIDATNGSDSGVLDATGMTGGTYTLNDIETTTDGKILVGNLAISSATGANFKVYMWDNLTSVPTVALNYALPTTSPFARLGDKFKVTGKFSDNTAVIWAADASNANVYKFGMTAGVFNTVPTVIALSNGAKGSTPSVAPLPNGDFYYNANGINPMKFTATGTIIDTIPGTIVGTGSNAISFLGYVAQTSTEYVATFIYGAGNENVSIVAIPNNNPKLATIYGKTPTLGANANANGTGDVALRSNANGSATLFVLSSNNGFGCYTTIGVVPVEMTSFTAQGTGRTVILNWNTATEKNSSEFVIERKSGKTNWSAVGVVKAMGTTTSKSSYTFVDKNLETDKYSYRLKQVDLDGTFAYSKVVELEIGTPVEFELSQNYPNPFNPSTRINFSLPADTRVTLEVYNIAGEQVAKLLATDLRAGYHTVDFDAAKYGVSSGIYFYRLTAGSNISVKKMMLLK